MRVRTCREVRGSERRGRHWPRQAAEPLESRVLFSGAIDIVGVQNAALDLPRVHALLRRTPDGTPLTAEDPFFGGDTFDIQGFYDTGASGVLLSQATADAMGVVRSTDSNGVPVSFEDVGVAGSSFFDVSEPLHVSIADFSPTRDVDNPQTYNSVYDDTFGPIRAQVGPADPPTRQFDFGTANSPLANRYVRVTETTTFTPQRGYGWQSGTIGGRLNSSGAAVNIDHNYTADGTFAVTLPDDVYDVQITFGDAAAAHDQMQVSIEGVAVETVSTAAGQFLTRSYTASVSDGQLTLRLRDLGGANAEAVINGLVIAGTPIEPPEPPLDTLDIIGMPAMSGKVVVMDPSPLNSDDALDTMRTYVYSPGTAYRPATRESDPGIPATTHHVDLSYVPFDRFTSVWPGGTGAAGPTMVNNPFIGPNPVLRLDPGAAPDNTPPIRFDHGNRTDTGSWLLDTGATASIISQSEAANLGVRYAPGTYQGDDPRLIDPAGNDVADQFTITIGGIGGSFQAAGFFIDAMSVPTAEGEPIRYLNVPVLVADITVQDPLTGQSLTLDGVFGMNNLVASLFYDEGGGAGGFGDSAAGAFDWVVFDEPNGTLGLNLADQPNTVAGRHVFYNNSAHDGRTPGRNAAGDDAAIATDKWSLLPGRGAATFGSYTSYSRGINGVMVDVYNLPANVTLNAGDFVFKVGNDSTPDDWANAPQPASVSVERGGGVDNSDRVTIIWNDGAIRNQWLGVTVNAGQRTGLAAPDTFYFGNAVGDTGNSATNTAVSGLDELLTRRNGTASAAVTNRYDFDRDRRVNFADQLIARRNPTTLATALPLIAPPAAAGATTVAPQSSPAATPRVDVSRVNLAKRVSVLPKDPAPPVEPAPTKTKARIRPDAAPVLLPPPGGAAGAATTATKAPGNPSVTRTVLGSDDSATAADKSRLRRPPLAGK